MKFKLDGQLISMQPQDLDGDGQVGGVETLQQRFNHDQQDVTYPSEMKDTLKELNEDVVDDSTGMSTIDMKSRLHFAVIPSVAAWDSMVACDFLPQKSLRITRQVKRLSVSENGMGRQEMVDAIGRKREDDIKKAGGGMMDNLKGFMGMGGQQ